MVEKVEVRLSSAHRLLYPRKVVLVSCADRSGKANVITLAWSMPTSIRPPMVAISVAQQSFSHKLIQETGEFVVNVPTMDIIKDVLICGRRSGKTCDKFKETQLTQLAAKIVKPPIIKECVAHLECRLSQQVKTGDHTLFVGEALAAYANEGIFDENFALSKVKPIYQIGENEFATISSETIIM